MSDGPCEYGAQTADEALEANISRLEERLRELESSDNPSAVRLQRPYSASDPNQEPPADVRRSSFLVLYLLSNPDQNSGQLESFLPQVLQRVSNTLSSSHPKRLVHAIQAEIILANYFIHSRRMLEGKYHLDTAVSLITGARLHTLRSASSSVLSVPASTDLAEEGEMINAFWTVYAMHNLWDTLGPSPAVFDRENQRIDTPWPLDISDYEQVDLAPAKHSKMAADDLRNMNSSARQQFIASFVNLDQVIDGFTGELPPVLTSASPPEIHTATLIHTLTYASTIRLHSVFADSDARSSTKSLAVAQAAITLIPTIDGLRQHIDVSRVPILDPIFGVLWGIVGRVVLKEIGRLRQSGSRSAVVGTRLRELEEMLGGLVISMEEFSGHSPFMAYQLEKLREAMST
ncbi:hypothetical protein V5O48_008451 [Marasmius crinis-equi]|uniref:Transcription factor domain-containing protein n=1 Tax=Marasmius crinis-equi TaxID=585013 RepID=A0ABR3F823_9AGAR